MVDGKCTIEVELQRRQKAQIELEVRRKKPASRVTVTKGWAELQVEFHLAGLFHLEVGGLETRSSRRSGEALHTKEHRQHREICDDSR